MLLLDTFTVDHTRMKAPAVRIVKIMHTTHKDIITVFDLRFCIPNKEIMPEKGMHTLEHLFASFMHKNLNLNNIEIIDLSPMGCRTGFYMSIIGFLNEERVIKAWTRSMLDIVKINKHHQIIGLSIYECGSYYMHSLREAQKIADHILKCNIHINKNDRISLIKR